MIKNLKKGFTLVELLVVMGVLAVLAGGLIVAINPIDKIRLSNDAKVQNDVSQIAGAAIAFAATNQGGYPGAATVQANLVPNEITVWPPPPAAAGYNPYAYTPAPPGCTTALANCASFTVTGNLTANRYAAFPTWRYDSATARACAWNGTACMP